MLCNSKLCVQPSSWGSDDYKSGGKSVFFFKLYFEIDMDRFLEGSPWTFNNHLLIFQKLKVGEDPLFVPLF